MKLGVRSQIFISSAALILAVGAGSLWLAGRETRRILVGRVTADLLTDARLARSLLVPPATSGPPRHPDPTLLVEASNGLARATGADVQILAGPTDAPTPSALLIVSDTTGQGMDRHELAGLAEVQRAWVLGEGIWTGQTTRDGTSASGDAVAVAVRWEAGETSGILRLRRDLTDIEAEVGDLRRIIGVAGLLGLALALLMSALASRVLSHTLTDLVRRARAMARGEGGRLAIPDDDALGVLAGSINDLGATLETTIGDLALQRDLLRALLEGLQDGVLALDAGLRIRAVNGAAHRLLGLSGDPTGRPLAEVSRHPDLLSLVRRVQDTPSDASPVETEFELSHPRRARFRATARPLQDGSLLLLLRDVTEAHRLEAMRRDFVANASHELRTPVAAIRASIEALLAGAAEEPEAGPALLGAIRRNALRLSQVVEDLLDLSRLDDPGAALPLGPVDVAPVVRDVLDESRPAAVRRSITLETRLPPDLPARTHAGALAQVLLNLVDNALKYTPEGGRVTVEGRAAGDRVHLSVTDTGPGIPPLHRDRIFERFYRVDTARSRALGGTGLGLAIVKHLADRLEGEVRLDCPDAGGSVFTVVLPRGG